MLLDNDFNVIISSIRKENDSVFRKFDVIGNGTAEIIPYLRQLLCMLNRAKDV